MTGDILDDLWLGGMLITSLGLNARLKCESFVIWMLDTLLALRFICHLLVVSGTFPEVDFP
jgi:hypothetical protein